MTRWIRSTEAARLLGLSVSTVQRLAEARLIPSLRDGHARWWRFPRAEIERLAGDAALTTLTISDAQHANVTPLEHEQE